MASLKPGWRWGKEDLQFRLDWEREDQELSPSEITKRVMMGTLKNVEDYLDFTMEVGEDYTDNWLPTLDLSLLVNGSNQVLHRFFEKPTSSNITVQKRTAMGEDAKIQIVSNDLVRRLMNTSEELGKGAKVEVVDDYAQKLTNSGYRGEQLKRIITNGIKGYENKRRRCLKDGRKLHRTAADSQGARSRKKLLAKSNWFRQRKKNDDGEQSTVSGSRSSEKRKGRTDKEPTVKTVVFCRADPKWGAS